MHSLGSPHGLGIRVASRQHERQAAQRVGETRQQAIGNQAQKSSVSYALMFLCACLFDCDTGGDSAVKTGVVLPQLGSRYLQIGEHR